MMELNSTKKLEDFPPGEWRLIQTPPAHGAWNMALDEVLLEGMVKENALPVLRLYAWEPACLSLGYAQPFRDVDEQALKNQGWEVVRRPTGGRAILHTDEITYAVITPHTEPRMAGGVLESYQRLSAALLDALHRIQVPANTQIEGFAPPGSQSGSRNAKGPVCFETPSSYEITINGRKLIGSAQARRREGVLQHGTLPLYGDLRRIVSVLAFQNEADRQAAAQRLAGRAATIEDSLGIAVSWEVAAQAIISAFQEVFNLRLVPSSLSYSECHRANELVVEKYASDTWTRRV